MATRAIKVWNAATAAWEDVAVLQPDMSAFITKGLISSNKGAIITSTGSAVAAQTVGDDGYVLTADSSQTNGIRWAAPSGGLDPFLLMGA